MIVNRSSSPIAAVASSSALGFAAAWSRPCVARPSRSWYVRTCCSDGSSARDLLDLRELARVLADDRHRLGVRQQIPHVACGAGGVHGNADRADLREREVDERPVEAVSREEGDVVAFPHPPGEEPVRVRPHAVVGVRPRNLIPAALVRLREVGRPLPVRRDCIAPQPRDSARLVARRSRPRSLRGLRHPLSLDERDSPFERETGRSC